MRRIAWSQLRFRFSRSAALLLGMLVATTAFTVLTAASRTSQLRTTGTVSAQFPAAYDILVRPRGSRTAIEQRTGTVQPNFLSGIYGGITLAQYRQIAQIPGVQVAAPVAMVGYAMLGEVQTVRLPARFAAYRGRQLFRQVTTWVSAGGSSRVAQPASFTYLTPDRLGLASTSADNPVSTEILPDGRKVGVCHGYRTVPGASPFSAPVQSAGVLCWSRRNGFGPGGSGGRDLLSLTPKHPGIVLGWAFPLLIAAVDPVAEARLDGLNRAVVSGRYLTENARPGVIASGTGQGYDSTIPVLATSAPGIGETAVTRLQLVSRPSAPLAMSAAQTRAAARAPGRTVLTVRVTAQQAYQRLLRQMTQPPGRLGIIPAVNQYWQVGPTSYRRTGSGGLQPVRVVNKNGVWRSKLGFVPPVDNADVQYRALVPHAAATASWQGGVYPWPVPRVVGVFDPARIRSFDPLSQVPLGPFQPTVAAPADAAARRALHGRNLLPSLNLGGYVSQPAQLLTTLGALPALENSTYFSGNLHVGDPISVIRVRVAGVTGPNPVSLERIKEVAQQIVTRTRLDVDIVAGSSPRPTLINLPAGRFGRPALALTEGWVKKGVALQILAAVDEKSVVLFGLILVVCALFVANSATAAVRGRRRELGVLACLGWTRPRLFATVLGELAVLGLLAGAAGGLASLPLAGALGLRASPARALLAVPVAMCLAVLAGAVPAWLASRAEPVASVRPAVLTTARAHHSRGITGLAVVNLLRTPGRTLVAVVSLAAGVAALTILTAVTLAFRGIVVGTLLGNAVAVQVRGVDYVAVTATIALGVLAVADVLFLNIRERAAELATIRSFGWPESALGRLVVTEGALIGLAGSVAGAAAGLAAAARFAGLLPAGLVTAAAAAAAAGAIVTMLACLLPAQLLRSLPTAHLLSEE